MQNVSQNSTQTVWQKELKENDTPRKVVNPVHFSPSEVEWSSAQKKVSRQSNANNFCWYLLNLY